MINLNTSHPVRIPTDFKHFIQQSVSQLLCVSICYVNSVSCINITLKNFHKKSVPLKETLMIYGKYELLITSKNHIRSPSLIIC